MIGFALAGGGTSYGLSDGLGSGGSEMFQAAAYSFTRFDAAYVSAGVAYAGHWGSTDRQLSVAGADRLSATFFASNFGGRIEGGYRFAGPSAADGPQYGLTPYAALQGQAFSMPSYGETGGLGPSPFALAYSAQTTTTVRTELGAWVDHTIALKDATLVLRARAAWAHDYFDNRATVTAAFRSLPDSIFTVAGAVPVKDSALLSAGAWLRFENNVSIGAKFDGEFASRSQTYAGTATLRYTW
ncbi:MAG TPA: autotransporter outer membrane beta-barrel domain-containing protein [Actinoplanes sp.]|nr:autotransporter outer membrane beta-barrel domain-containing protein [Actinoplanes sp.]